MLLNCGNPEIKVERILLEIDSLSVSVEDALHFFSLGGLAYVLAGMRWISPMICPESTTVSSEQARLGSGR